MLYVVVVGKLIVTGFVSAAFAGFCTEPAEIVPVPGLLPVAAVRIGEAAATFAGSVIATLRPFTAARVGRIMKRSPVAGVPLTTMLRPSARNGSATVPEPVIVIAAPLSSR